MSDDDGGSAFGGPGGGGGDIGGSRNEVREFMRLFFKLHQTNLVHPKPTQTFTKIPTKHTLKHPPKHLFKT